MGFAFEDDDLDWIVKRLKDDGTTAGFQLAEQLEARIGEPTSAVIPILERGIEVLLKAIDAVPRDQVPPRVLELRDDWMDNLPD